MVCQSQDTPKGEAILVRGARQLLTLRGASDALPGDARRGAALGDLGVISEGAVLIRGGKILQAGPSRRVENLAEARRAREIDAAGRVVMPGFVDCNAALIVPHPPLDEYEDRLTRPFGHEPSSPDSSPVQPDENFWRGEHEIRRTPGRRIELRARMIAEGVVRHGTTTAAANCGNGRDRSGDMKLMRALARLNRKPLSVVPAYYGARFPPREYQENRGAYLEWICNEVLPAIARRKLARRVAVNCDAGGFPADVAQQYLERARQFGFAIAVHAGDSAAAVRLGIHMEGASVALDRIDEQDAAALGGSRTMACSRRHLPSTGAAKSAGWRAC